MCGIAGFLDLRRSLRDEQVPRVIAEMISPMRHRGPDDEGIWFDVESGIALGHRRLAVLEVSTEGHEPMLSADGRYVLVFNGEIYNHRSLRKELGHRFRGECDAETLVEAVAAWGIARTIDRIDGMFAFAVWDRHGRTLTLARDRMGEKPLYYGWMGGHFLFGSELKALQRHPEFRGVLDRHALTLYLRHSYVPAPWSIYEGIRKLPPATSLTISTEVSGHRPEPSEYWSVLEVAQAGLRDPLDVSDDEAVDLLEVLLLETVESRMISDVPLGGFLSGGIDSSTVVALMQAVSSGQTRTFTIGVREQGFDEAVQATNVAGHLGTDHTTHYVTPEQAHRIVPELPWTYDEPFGDSSQIPTILVSDLASQHVKVALSGDGGDEVFGGYVRYQFDSDLWRRVQQIPAPLRRAGARGLLTISPSGWDRLLRPLRDVLPGRLDQAHPGQKVHKLADTLTAESPEHVFERLVSIWQDPAELVFGSVEPSTVITDPARWGELDDFVAWMMYVDSVTYLPDDILTKVDRASMSRSLEVRVPLLAPRVVEFAWRLPPHLRAGDVVGKVALRRVLQRYLPAHLLDRPKQGFGVPVGEWLRGPLRGWAEELLDEAQLCDDGVFDPGPIRQLWIDHLAGRQDGGERLWTLLMFQAWWRAAGPIGGRGE